jgi:hypothetical protein
MVTTPMQSPPPVPEPVLAEVAPPVLVEPELAGEEPPLLEAELPDMPPVEALPVPALAVDGVPVVAPTVAPEPPPEPPVLPSSRPSICWQHTSASRDTMTAS